MGENKKVGRVWQGKGDMNKAGDLALISCALTYIATAILTLGTADSNAIPTVLQAVYFVLNAYVPTTFTFVFVIGMQNVILAERHGDRGKRLTLTFWLFAASVTYVMLYLVIAIRFDVHECVFWNIALAGATLLLLRLCFASIEQADQEEVDVQNPFIPEITRSRPKQ